MSEERVHAFDPEVIFSGGRAVTSDLDLSGIVFIEGPVEGNGAGNIVPLFFQMLLDDRFPDVFEIPVLE
ncbi:hypothetical protein SDC9_151344 [bioreactor metagenome]|uniref:Uncharacterized protein n=1 Tax=bioreactor metagenome TaxID=1076179 RepID=A0A645EQ12_9ZZZZ